MFANLEALPPDALLGLTKLFNDDKRARKIDLGVGVYRTPDNRTPVMEAVAIAQRRLVVRETTKVYISPEGAPGFGDALRALVFGDAIAPERAAVLQTPGGCGALRIGADLLKRVGATTISVGSPTWVNHHPLMSAAGLKISTIPYYDASSGKVDFDGFLTAASKLGPSDALLLHGACHNPTGADLSVAEIDAVVALAEKNGFLPFVDLAYHGFANGLDADAYIVRRMAARLPEFLVSYSCSKHFGLYRERTGALMMIGADGARANAIKSHAITLARQIYSMPPAHGGFLVADILSTPDLAATWRRELEAMRLAVAGNRRLLVKTARERQLGSRLDFIEGQFGMFSILPIDEKQVMALRERHGIYVANNGRANLCGVNEGNVDHLCEGLAEVLGR